MDSAKPPAKKPNTSLETRKTVRREKADRRIVIRFEPTKKNRRADKGRRSSDSDCWGSKPE